MATEERQILAIAIEELFEFYQLYGHFNGEYVLLAELLGVLRVSMVEEAGDKISTKNFYIWLIIL